MKKRIISLLLSLVMITGLIPNIAFADDTGSLRVDGTALGIDSDEMIGIYANWDEESFHDLMSNLANYSEYAVYADDNDKDFNLESPNGGYSYGDYYYNQSAGTVSEMTLGYMSETTKTALEEAEVYTDTGWGTGWAFCEPNDNSWIKPIPNFKFYISVDGEMYEGETYLSEIAIEPNSKIVIYLTLGEEPSVSVCQHENTEERSQIDADCTNDGYEAGTYCKDCKKYIEGGEKIPALGHKYQGAEYYISQAPTSKSSGYLKQNCTVCETPRDVITFPKLTSTNVGSTNSKYTTKSVEADCTNGGYTLWKYNTTTYGTYEFKTNETNPVGHDYQYDEASGKMICSKCFDETDHEHNYEAVGTTSPTCTEKGYTTYKCTVCKESYKADYTAALGHHYVKNDGKSLAATETEDGYDVFECERCNDSYKETIPMLSAETKTVLYYANNVLQGKEEVSVGDILCPEVIEKDGYTAKWQYNNADLPESGLTVTSDMGKFVRLYEVYTPIDYTARIDLGEQGYYPPTEGYDKPNYSLTETNVGTEEHQIWQGRYDVQIHSYGTDDATGEPYSSKTYDNGNQYYYSFLPKPTCKPGYYFTGWTIEYYDNGFENEATDANGRRTEMGNSSVNHLGSEAGTTPNDTTKAMFGNCVVTAHYTDKAYVVALPKGDSAISGYEHPINYNSEKYKGYTIVPMGGTSYSSTKLETEEAVRAVSGKDTVCDFDNYNYWAFPAGSSSSFWVYLSVGYSQRFDSDGEFWRYAGAPEKHSTDFFGYSSDRGTAGKNRDYTDYTVKANGVELICSTAVYGAAFSICNNSNKDTNIERCDELVSKSEDGVIKVEISDLEPNRLRVETVDKTGNNLKVAFDENSPAYAGELGKFAPTRTPEGPNDGSFSEDLPAIYWGENITFTIQDESGNVIKDGIKVSYANREIYSNMNRLTYYHYGDEKYVDNGEYVTLYPDSNGNYTLKYMGECAPFGKFKIRIEEYTLDRQKEDAAKELYDDAAFSYNIKGLGNFTQLLESYLEYFWNIPGKGNIMYNRGNGNVTYGYPGNYVIDGKKMTGAEAKEYVEALPEPAPGQSNNFQGWSSGTKSWASYYYDEYIDKAGEQIEAALRELLAAQDVSTVRDIVTKYSSEIRKVRSQGTAKYNEKVAADMAGKLEKDYAANLNDSGYAVAEVKNEDIKNIPDGKTLIINAENTSDEPCEKFSVKVATDDFKELAEKDVSFTLNTDIGTVALSADAVKNIANSPRLDKVTTGVPIAASSAVYLNITLQSAEETPVLTEEQKKAVGSKKIIDLTVTNARGAVIDLGGADVTVTVPYELSSGETTSNIGVWYINNLGEAEIAKNIKAEYDENGELWVTFTTNHFSAYVVAKAVTKVQRHSGGSSHKVSLAKKTSLSMPDMQKNTSFTDVAKSYWAYDAIEYVAKNGFMKTENKIFNPNGTITFDELSEMLSSIISEKYNNSRYAEKDIITRSKLAVCLAEICKIKGIEIGLDDEFSEKDALEALTKMGILDNAGANNLPNAVVTRAETATAIYRMFATK